MGHRPVAQIISYQTVLFKLNKETMNPTVPQLLTHHAVHQEVSLRDIIAIFFRRLKGMTVVFSLAMVIALIWILFIRGDIYEATSKILVRVGYEQATSVTVMDRQTPVIGYRHQDVATEVHILSSTDVLGRVVDRLNLTEMDKKPRPPGFFKGIVYDIKQSWATVNEWFNDALIWAGLRKPMSPREFIIDTLSSSLLVGSSQESNVLVALLRMPQREGVAVVLDEILKEYLEARMRFFREDAAISLFQNKVNQILEELRKVEAEVKQLETKHNIVNYAVQEKLLLEREKQLEAQLKEDRQELKALNDKLETLKVIHNSSDASFASLGAFPQQSFAANLMSELAKIEDDRIRLSMAAGGGNQRSVSENNQRFDATLRLLKSNIESTTAEKNSVVKERSITLKETRKELEALHEHKTTWQDLSRRSDLLESDYKLYRKDLEEASATSSMQNEHISNVKIIQHPLDPIRPAGIRKLYLICIAAVLSAFFAIAWASLAEFFDHRIYSTDQLAKHLGVPVAGVIPRINFEETGDSPGPVGSVA